MGKKDNVTKTYMKNSAVFADAFNFYVYNGEQVLKPEDLKELDTAESVIIFDTAGSKQISESKQKYRDVLKSAVFMRNNKTVYAVFGIENQSEVHYAMPVRCFVYDAMQYDRQVHNSPNHSNNKKTGSTSSNTAYLSGFSKEDRLTPVITLVIYYGSERWDGARTIHEMMDIEDERLMEYVQDYRINLIEPAGLDPTELDKFSTSLKKVLGYIKYSNNKQDLMSFISDNDMTVDVDAARVLNAVTKTHIDIPEEAEELDMCKAIEDLINDSKAEGKADGIAIGRADGIAIGRADGIAAGEAKIIIMMHKNGFSAEQIASATSKSVDDVRAILANGEPIPA